MFIHELPPFCSSTEGLGWGGTFFFFFFLFFLRLILGYWRLFPCSVIPTAPQCWCFVCFDCQALKGSLEQNNPELVLCHRTQEHLHGVSCRKKNSSLFFWIFQGLLQSPGVLTRPWRCYRSQGISEWKI